MVNLLLRVLMDFFYLQHLIQATIESIGVFNQILNHEVQEIRFFGDLELRQKGLLRSEGLYETYNHSIELSDYSLSELLLHSFNRKCMYCSYFLKKFYQPEKKCYIYGRILYII